MASDPAETRSEWTRGAPGIARSGGAPASSGLSREPAEPARLPFPEPAPVMPGRKKAERPAVDWRRRFAGGSSRQILARIVPGDPLGVRRVVARRVRERALLMDADRVQLRAFARCARLAGSYTGRPALEPWLADVVDEALRELLQEEAFAAHDPRGAGAALPPAFGDLAAPLGLEPAAMRRACAAFNAAPEPDRQAFFRLVVESRSLDEVAHASGCSASEVGRRAARALDLLLRCAAPLADSSRRGTP